jgi:Rap1a immunity proteins
MMRNWSSGCRHGWFIQEGANGGREMKRIWGGVFVIAIAFLISPVADAQLYQGQKLVEDWKAYKNTLIPKPLKSPVLVQHMANYVGYVAGVYDANYDIFALPSDVTVDQICNAVGKYLDDHPQEWHELAVSLVLRGLTAMESRQVPAKKKGPISSR